MKIGPPASSTSSDDLYHGCREGAYISLLQSRSRFMLSSSLHSKIVSNRMQEALPPSIQQQLEHLSSIISSMTQHVRKRLIRKVYTKEELSRFTGGKEPSQSTDIYISILGEVFDVTSKPQFYGKQRQCTGEVVNPDFLCIGVLVSVPVQQPHMGLRGGV